MAEIFALLGLGLGIIFMAALHFFMRNLGKKMERELAELKRQASEGTAQVAEYYRCKIPPEQAEEFGLTGAEDRKWVAYALFRSRTPEHPTERDELVGQALNWLIYPLAVLGSLLLLIGTFVLVAGRIETGAFFCLVAIVGLATMVLMSDFKKQGAVFREEREVLERIYAQFGDVSGEPGDS